MAAISLPEKGQPLDLNYIYEMASQINNLTNQISVRSSSSSSVNNVPETTANLRIWALELPVSATNASNTSTANMPTFNYSSAGFKQPPIVTATILNKGGVSGVDAGNSAQVILTDVNTQTADGIIRFGLSGGLNISVHLIAVGIPN